MISKTGNARILLAALVGLGAIVSTQSPASAADLVDGYAPAKSSHYRQARVARTTHVYRETRDCQLLKVTEPDRSEIVEVCFRPIF